MRNQHEWYCYPPVLRSAGTKYFFLSMSGMSLRSAFSQITCGEQEPIDVRHHDFLCLLKLYGSLVSPTPREKRRRVNGYLDACGSLLVTFYRFEVVHTHMYVLVQSKKSRGKIESRFDNETSTRHVAAAEKRKQRKKL